MKKNIDLILKFLNAHHGKKLHDSFLLVFFWMIIILIQLLVIARYTNYMSEALYDETSISLFFGIFLHVTNIVLYQRDTNKIIMWCSLEFIFILLLES